MKTGFVFIALEDLEAGERFLAAVEESYKRLADFPLIGTEKRFADKRLQKIRRWQIPQFEKYLIFYTVSEDTVEIVCLLHSSRDIGDLLG